MKFLPSLKSQSQMVQNIIFLYFAEYYVFSWNISWNNKFFEYLKKNIISQFWPNYLHYLQLKIGIPLIKKRYFWDLYLKLCCSFYPWSPKVEPWVFRWIFILQSDTNLPRHMHNIHVRKKVKTANGFGIFENIEKTNEKTKDDLSCDKCDYKTECANKCENCDYKSNL